MSVPLWRLERFGGSCEPRHNAVSAVLSESSMGGRFGVST